MCSTTEAGTSRIDDRFVRTHNQCLYSSCELMHLFMTFPLHSTRTLPELVAIITSFVFVHTIVFHIVFCDVLL